MPFEPRKMHRHTFGAHVGLVAISSKVLALKGKSWCAKLTFGAQSGLVTLGEINFRVPKQNKCRTNDAPLAGPAGSALLCGMLFIAVVCLMLFTILYLIKMLFC